MLVHNSKYNYYLYSPRGPITCIHQEWCQYIFKLKNISVLFAAHGVKSFGLCCPFSRNLGKLDQYQSGICFQM